MKSASTATWNIINNFRRLKLGKYYSADAKRTHFPRKKPGYSQVPRERVRERSCYTSRRWIRRSEFILSPAGVEDKGDEGWEELRKQYEEQFGIEPEQEGKSNSKKKNVIIRATKPMEKKIISKTKTNFQRKESKTRLCQIIGGSRMHSWNWQTIPSRLRND